MTVMLITMMSIERWLYMTRRSLDICARGMFNSDSGGYLSNSDSCVTLVASLIWNS